MGCSACNQSFEAEALSGCTEATITGGETPPDLMTYLPYILAGLGSLAFIFLIASGNKKEKTPAKIPKRVK